MVTVIIEVVKYRVVKYRVVKYRVVKYRSSEMFIESEKSVR